MGDNMIDWLLLQLFKNVFTGNTPTEFKDFLKHDGYLILYNVLSERSRQLPIPSERDRLIRLHTFFTRRIREYLNTAD